MKKKVLIIAPISKRGGRELETGFIASILSNTYDVSVVSTSNYYANSQINEFSGFSFTSLNLLVFKNSFIVRIVLFVAALLKSNLNFNSNTLNSPTIKKIVGIENRKRQVLYEQIDKASVVFICAQVYSNYIPEVLNYTKKKNLPVIFRTTGTIYDDSRLNKLDWVQQVDVFLHHSNANAKRLYKVYTTPYYIIDQCAVNENNLLNIPVREAVVSSFLILSRLAPEKQIETVIRTFNKLKHKLFIYGDGLEEEKLKKLVISDNIIFGGYVENKELHKVFSVVDCLIISSKEEAGPLSAIESMAAGVVIISTKVGAMLERLPAYDFWYDGSENNLEEVIIKIRTLKKDQIKKKSLELREHYIKNFSLQIIANKYLEAVESVIV